MVQLIDGFVCAILQNVGSVVVVRSETRCRCVWMRIHGSDGQANRAQARLRNHVARILLMRHRVENLKGLPSGRYF